MPDKRETLIVALQQTQAEISALLEAEAERQDWQPGTEEWSFRYVAAHLATVEEDCMFERLQKIANGGEPYFDYYLNTGWDFSEHDLMDSLQAWRETRQKCMDFVLALPDEKLALVGTHTAFGAITVLDVLQIMLDHDQEHLAELKEYVNVA